MLQIELQRWFRQGLRHLRANAKPESPCNYGYTERMVHQILLLLSGTPIWHDEQLHLAEWQALQQLDYLVNLNLAVDAKNLAIAKLKACNCSWPFDFRLQESRRGAKAQGDTTQYEEFGSSQDADRHLCRFPLCVDLLLRGLPLHPDRRICGPKPQRCRRAWSERTFHDA